MASKASIDDNIKKHDNIYSMILEIVDFDCKLTDVPSNDFESVQL